MLPQSNPINRPTRPGNPGYTSPVEWFDDSQSDNTSGNGVNTSTSLPGGDGSLYEWLNSQATKVSPSFLDKLFGNTNAYLAWVSMLMQQGNADADRQFQLDTKNLDYERTKFSTLYNQFLASGMSPSAAMQAASGLQPQMQGSSGAGIPSGAGTSDGSGFQQLMNGVGSIAGVATGLGTLANAIAQTSLNFEEYKTASWYQNGVRSAYKSDDFQNMIRHALKGGADYSDGEWFSFDRVRNHWMSDDANEDEKAARHFYESGIANDSYFSGAIDHYWDGLIKGRGGSYADSFLAGQKKREWAKLDKEISLLGQDEVKGMFTLSAERSSILAKTRALLSAGVDLSSLGLSIDNEGNVLYTDPDSGESFDLADGQHDDLLNRLAPAFTSRYDALECEKRFRELSMYTDHPEIFDELASKMMNEAKFEKLYFQNLALIEDTRSELYGTPQYKSALKFCELYEKYNLSIQNEIAQQNADTNSRNADINQQNADINQQNADINQLNANTNRYNAKTNRYALKEEQRHNKYLEYLGKESNILTWETAIHNKDVRFGPVQISTGAMFGHNPYDSFDAESISAPPSTDVFIP